MHPAIELLLKRMESNPDEFVRGHVQDRTWGSLIERYKEYMTKEDRDALRIRYSEIQMNQLHKEVMAELLRESRQEVDSAATFRGSVLVGNGGGGNSVELRPIGWDYLQAAQNTTTQNLRTLINETTD